MAMVVATTKVTGHSGPAVERLQGTWETDATYCDQVLAMRFDPELQQAETSYHRSER